VKAWVKIKNMTGTTKVEHVTSVVMDEKTIRIQYRVDDKMPAEYRDERERLESLEIEP
jgi:hypothetical protein